MQIHEVTTAVHKIPKLNEGMMDTIKGYFNTDPSMANLDAAQRGQKMASNALVKNAADKGFRVWQVYIHGIESRITDPIKKKAFNDRTDGLYKKYLLSFVTQNMLGGKSLSTLLNKDDIIGLVDEISKPMIPTATPYAINTAAVPAAPAKNITTHTATPNNPNAVSEAAATAKTAMGQIAGGQPNKMSSTGGTTVGTAANTTQHQANPNNPNQAGTNTPAKQKEDFEKLVFASASAAIDSEHADLANNPMQIALQLQKFGPQIIQAAGTNQVKSTGNTALDGTLKTMGFTLT